MLKPREIGHFLLLLEFPVVASLVLISMVKASLLPLFVGCGLAFWLLRFWLVGCLTKRTPIDLSIILLTTLALITTQVTAIPTITIPQVFRLISGVIIFYSIINWTVGSKHYNLLIFGLLAVSLMLAMYTPLSVDWNFNKLPLIPKTIYGLLPNLVTDLIHRNVMAGTLIILLPIILGILVFSWKSHPVWMKIFLLFSASSVVISIVLTQSRGAIISLLIVIIAILVLRLNRGWIIIPITFTGFILLVTIVGTSELITFLSSGVSLTGIEGRLEVWSRAIYLIQEFPITGIGMGLFGDVVDLLYPLFLAAPGSVPHAHNLFLQIAVDLGIPGLITWLSIWVIILVVSGQIYRSGELRKNQLMTGIGAGLICSQLALLLHGMTDSVTWGMVRPAPLVWVVWGIAVASWYLYFREQETDTVVK